MKFYLLADPAVLLSDRQLRRSLPTVTLPADLTQVADAKLNALGAARAPVEPDVQPWQGLDWDGADWTVLDRPFAELLTARKAELTRTFHARRQAGTDVPLGGGGSIRVETTHAAQTELQGLVARLERVGGTQAIVTRAGDQVTVDAAMAAALRDAVEAHVAACYTRDADLHAALDAVDPQAAEAPAQLYAIDLETGWP